MVDDCVTDSVEDGSELHFVVGGAGLGTVALKDYFVVFDNYIRPGSESWVMAAAAVGVDLEHDVNYFCAKI